MEDFLLTGEDILERVDEYTLYCFYLGFKPDLGTTYHSPLRKDDEHPSFKLFAATKLRNREIGWKDHGLGEGGDIFKLVKLLFGYPNVARAAARIASDLDLGPKLPDERRVKYIMPPREPAHIVCRTRTMTKTDYCWWGKYNISSVILAMYGVEAISCYWLRDSEQLPKFPHQGFGFKYPVSSHTKLYFPLAPREFKFRSDLTEKDLEGSRQLTGQGPLIITKSLKDVMCLRSFGYDAVAARGESVLVPDEFLRYFDKMYGTNNILVLFDNDGKHKADSYPYRKIWIPKDSGEKDTTDFCRRYGAVATKELLKQLI